MKTTRIKRKVLDKQLVTANSITCGKDNTASLGCRFYDLEDGEVATVFIAGKIHEGHNNIMHGGLSGAVLDEVMGRSTLNCILSEPEEAQPRYVTAEMTVKYKKPIEVGKKMYAYGRVEHAEGRCCYATSEIVDESGEIMSTASGVYVEVDVPSEESDDYRKYNKSREELSGDDPEIL